MAKQCGPYIFKGTIDGVCFYIANGEGLVRASNPLSSVRVKEAPEFAGLRRYADWLKVASPMAAEAYKALPATRKRTHYQKLTGKAIHWLKQGKTREEATALLAEEITLITRELQPATASPDRRSPAAKQKPARLKEWIEVTGQVKLPLAASTLKVWICSASPSWQNSHAGRLSNMPRPANHRHTIHNRLSKAG